MFELVNKLSCKIILLIFIALILPLVTTPTFSLASLIVFPSYTTVLYIVSINPMVGTEQQTEDMVRYLLKEFEEDPKSIWGSNLFGKSLYELINEGLHNKLEHMPEESRKKLSETLERIINEGSNGLICILL